MVKHPHQNVMDPYTTLLIFKHTNIHPPADLVTPMEDDQDASQSDAVSSSNEEEESDTMFSDYEEDLRKGLEVDEVQ
jgi:hypothetical protein